MNTPATKVSELEHNWQLVDVKGKILGRVASEIAQNLSENLNGITSAIWIVATMWLLSMPHTLK